MLATAVCAALALTAAAGAGTASASKFVPESGSVSVGATNYGPIGFSSSWNENTCYSSELTGVAWKTSQLSTSTTGFWECTYSYTSEVHMNGCNFIFHPGAEEKSGYFGGSVEIGPSSCGPIVFSGKSGLCTLSYYPKSGISAHYTNIGSGSTAEVEVHLEATNLKEKGEGSACGGGKTDEKGHIKAVYLIKARNSSGTQKGIHIEELPYNVGLYIAGEKSAEEAKQPKFNAEEYSVIISGSQTEENVFQLPSAGEIHCEAWVGSGWLSQATSAPVLAPTLSECEAIGRAATIRTNGCTFVFHVANASAPYTGSQELSCATGKSLEAVAYSSPGVTLCTVTLPPQTIGVVSYVNKGTGYGRYVSSTTSGSELQYSVSGGNGSCGKEGSFTGGEYVGAFKLEAGS